MSDICISTFRTEATSVKHKKKLRNRSCNKPSSSKSLPKLSHCTVLRRPEYIFFVELFFFVWTVAGMDFSGRGKYRAARWKRKIVLGCYAKFNECVHHTFFQTWQVSGGEWNVWRRRRKKWAPIKICVLRYVAVKCISNGARLGLHCTSADI